MKDEQPRGTTLGAAMILRGSKTTVYHASNAKITDFDPAKIKRLGDYGPGFYFATDKESTYGHGKHIYEVVIDVNKPLEVSSSKPSKVEMAKLLAAFQVEPDLLDGGEHPIVALFALLEHAFSIEEVTRVLEKLGYDSVLVSNEIIRKREPGVRGDYCAVFRAAQILSVTELKADAGADKEAAIARAVIDYVRKQHVADSRDVRNVLIDQRLVNPASFADNDLVTSVLKQLLADKTLVKQHGFYSLGDHSFSARLDAVIEATNGTKLLASRLSDAIEQYPQFLKEIEELQKQDPSGNLKYLDWQLKQLKRSEPLNEIISLTETFHKRRSQLEKKDLNSYKTLGDLREAIEALGKSRKERQGEAQEDLFSQERARATKNGIVVYDSDDVLAIKPRSVEESCYFGNNTKWCISATESQNYYNNYSLNGQHFYFIINKNLPIRHPFQKVSWQGLPNRKPSFWRSDDVDEEGNSKPFQRNSPDFKKWKALTPNLEVILDRIAEHLKKNPKNPFWLAMERGDDLELDDDDDKKSLARNPDITLKVWEQLSRDKNKAVSDVALENPTHMTPESLELWANNKRWQPRLHVVRNPSAPPAILEKLANDVREEVRRAVAHHPNTPLAILEKLANDVREEVRSAVAYNPNTPPAILKKLANDVENVRRAVARSPNTPPAVLGKLAKDEGMHVAVADNPNTPIALLETLAGSENSNVRIAVGANPSTPMATLETLAGDKNQNVRYAVAGNPGTPLAILEQLAGDDEHPVREVAQENLDRRSLSARVDALVEATMQVRLSAHARLALEEAAALVARATPRFLGEGMEGQTYETPDEFALKVTREKDVAQIARRLMRKPMRNFVRVYAVEPAQIGKQKEFHIYMENLRPAPKEWKAFANAVWAGAFEKKRPSALAKRYLRKAGPLKSKIQWYKNLLAQAKALRLPFLDVHEDNIMMRGRVPVLIDP